MYWSGWQQEKYEPRLSKLIRLCSVSELCRISLDPAASDSHLEEYYGQLPPSETPSTRQKIRQFCTDFTLEDLLRIKGKRKLEEKEQQQQHPNNELRKMLRRKLDTEVVSKQTRSQLWLEFTGHYAQKGRYELMKAMAFDNSFEEIIQLDLKRTKGTSAMLEAAHNVLSTFVKYNAYIGYCQGMSFIVMFLLELGFKEDEAFSVLRYVCNQVLPLDYFTNMLSVFSDKFIIIELLKYLNRDLYAKIKSLDSDLGSVLFPVLLCLLTKNESNREVAIIIWDYLMVEGFVAMYKACLVLFDLVQDEIMGTKDFAQTMIRVEQKIQSMKDPEPFRKGMRIININTKVLQLCRIAINDKQQSSLLEPLIKNQKPKSVASCNANYHICLQHLENEKAKCNTMVSFVYSRKPQITFITNYCDTVESKYFFRNSRKYKDQDFLMMVRSHHCCLQVDAEREFDEETFRVNILKKQTKSIMMGEQESKQTTITSTKKEIKMVTYHNNAKPNQPSETPFHHIPPTMPMSPKTGRVIPHFKEPTSTMIRNKSLLKSESLAFIDRLMAQNQSFSNLLDLCEQPQELQEDSVSDMDTGASGDLHTKKH